MLPLHWVYKATEKYYGAEGQQSIDPVVFFKLMLIGYLENLCSDRRIINMAKLRLDMLYFIGYNIDEALPWHSTLHKLSPIRIFFPACILPIPPSSFLSIFDPQKQTKGQNLNYYSL